MTQSESVSSGAAPTAVPVVERVRVEAPTPAGYRWFCLFAALGMLLAAGLLRLCQVSADNDRVVWQGYRLPGVCTFRLVTGRPCPGCGMTRGMVQVAHGQWAAAHALHPGALWFGGWLAAQLVVRLALAAAPRRFVRYWMWDLSLSLGTGVVAIYLPWVLCRLW